VLGTAGHVGVDSRAAQRVFRGADDLLDVMFTVAALFVERELDALVFLRMGLPKGQVLELPFQ